MTKTIFIPGAYSTETCFNYIRYRIKIKDQYVIDYDVEEVMSERPSYRYENKEYLLEVFMNQLGITEQDLENDPSWMRAKVREMNIDKVLDTQN